MKILYPFIAVISLLSIFVSCTPDDVLERASMQQSADSNYLSKIYQVDSIAGATIDTIMISTYTYDNLKRVISFTDSLFHTQGTVPVPKRGYFYYSGTDTLPYKTIEIIPTVDGDDSTIRYFFFDAHHLRKMDSVFTYQGPLGPTLRVLAKRYYSYSLGKISDTSFESSIFQVYFYNKSDSAILDVNGNMLYSSQSVYNGVNDSFLYRFIYTANYDNHPSPFVHLSNLKCRDIFPPRWAGFKDFPQNNNPLHLIEYIQGTTSHYDIDYTGHYLYNFAGYPKEISYLPTPNYPGRFSKLIFVYKTL